MKRVRHVIIGIGYGLAVAACGGGGGAGPLSPSEAEDVCTDLCERQLACGSGEPLPECVAECSEETRFIRGDVIADTVDCVRDLPCDADEDVCLVCEPTSAHAAYEEDCREQLTGCIDPSAIVQICDVDFVGDDFGAACLFSTDLLRDLGDCLAEPDCTTRLSCLQAVLEIVDA